MNKKPPDYATTRDLFRAKTKPILEHLYPQHSVDELLAHIEALLPEQSEPPQKGKKVAKWSEKTVMLITYANSLKANDVSPLRCLQRFLDAELKNMITVVHLLPFYPYTSDDGFAVSNYLAVNPEVGNWEDVTALSQNYKLMFDLVANHVSADHAWAKQLKRGEAPGKDYFILLTETEDVSGVVRPRSASLKAPIETVAGDRHVWATFSHDQLDVNYANPDLLLEYLQIIKIYLERGARYLRLDAIAYLWKQLGTPCIHLAQTHAVIRLMRMFAEEIDPRVVLITETNVPNLENLSYFGNRNEAHVIYNFSLPPLLLHALLSGTSKFLNRWSMSLPPAPKGCTYLNFTASHDGIGLRPLEGLVDDDEFYRVIDTVCGCGGELSTRERDGKALPYELNCTYFEALKGTFTGTDDWQVARFLCSQTVMLSVEGIPAFYIHSLLASPNDYEGYAITGRKRSLNRKMLQETEVQSKLQDAHGYAGQVFTELKRLIQIRQQQPAFHPNATQFTLHLGDRLFGVWRQSRDREQSIFCIHNLTNASQKLQLSDINLLVLDEWIDLITGGSFDNIHGEVTIQPYQSLWITNRIKDE